VLSHPVLFYLQLPLVINTGFSFLVLQINCKHSSTKELSSGFYFLLSEEKIINICHKKANRRCEFKMERKRMAKGKKKRRHLL